MTTNNAVANICPICENTLDDQNKNISVLFQKGAEGINECSQKCGREEIVAESGQRVHERCCRKWINEKDIKRSLQENANSKSPIKKKSARVSIGPYDPKRHCLFCSKEIAKSTHGHDEGASEVKTHCFPQTILQLCTERSDEWAFSVRGRIEYFGKDLYPADCIYHRQCSLNFRSGRNIPQKYRPNLRAKGEKPGRPQDEDQRQAFLQTCKYFEEKRQGTVNHSRVGLQNVRIFIEQ